MKKTFLYFGVLTLAILIFAGCQQPQNQQNGQNKNNPQKQQQEQEQQANKKVTVGGSLTITDDETSGSITSDAESNSDTMPIVLGYDEYDDNRSKEIDYDKIRDTLLDEFTSQVTIFNLPFRDENPNIVYVSALESSYALSQVTRRILAYNLNDNTFEVIYEDKALSDDDDSNFVFSEYRTYAMQGDKLIIVKSPVDYSPGVCYNIWLAASGTTPSATELLYLDVTNPEEGLKPYSVPEWKLTEERQVLADCEKEYPM
ncbi:hypothetical protein GF340_00285 [Candidatus Peregrinibacteria bacterium]|nr:hypothetical protein [Candidatus Peregrinibacteria bacterium]